MMPLLCVFCMNAFTFHPQHHEYSSFLRDTSFLYQTFRYTLVGNERSWTAVSSVLKGPRCYFSPYICSRVENMSVTQLDEVVIVAEWEGEGEASSLSQLVYHTVNKEEHMTMEKILKLSTRFRKYRRTRFQISQELVFYLFSFLQHRKKTHRKYHIEQGNSIRVF